jgi:phytol kinase
MLTPFLTLLLPPLLLVPAMGLLSSIDSHSPIETELRRKAFHTCIGLASLTFPFFLNEPWKVIVALSLTVGWMMAVKRVPLVLRYFGGVLHDTDRVSHGELYFAASIGALLLASDGNTVLYVVPILILTFADAIAAIVGRLYPVMPLGGPARGKTATGSAAFFVVAFVVTWPVLIAYTDLSAAVSLVATVTVASATCLAEAISTKGFDNLAVPTVALFILKLFVVGA